MESSASILIKFSTCDGQEVSAEKKLVMRASTVASMIDDNFDPDDVIPLPEITHKTFVKVLDFLKHVDLGNAPPTIEKPLRSNDMRDVTTEFYAEYINVPTDDEVQDIILAANYLDIKELLALGCAKMGSIIRGLTIPEFRKRFNIVNDFSPEEEAEPFDESKLAELAEAYEK